MAISHEDRDWFKKTVEDALVARDEHCKNEIKKAIDKHVEKSIAHNPVKSAGLFASFAIIWEAIRSVFIHK